MSVPLVRLTQNGLSIVERLRVARFCYKNGIEYISDSEYDKLMLFLKRVQPNHILILTSYDDDDTPYDELFKAGMTDEQLIFYSSVIKTDTSKEEEKSLRESMNEKVSKSITPFFTWDECYKQFEAVVDKELCLSAKIDGIMGKTLFKSQGNGLHKFKFAVTKSRAEDSLPIDITRNTSRLVPLSFLSTTTEAITADGEEASDIIFTGEIFCLENAVPIINKKYGLSLVNGRTAGLSMIRTKEYEDEDYKYMNFGVHNCSLGSSLSAGFEFAESLGFSVVPYFTYTYHHMSFEDFKLEMSGVIAKIKRLSEESSIPTDGMVVEINDRQEFSRMMSETVYDGGNFAVKVGNWKPGVYVSEVEDIILTQKADRFSFKASISPVVTSSGITVRTINLYNPATIISNGIKIGSRVCFIYKNETTPLFVCNADDKETYDRAMKILDENGSLSSEYTEYEDDTEDLEE